MPTLRIRYFFNKVFFLIRRFPITIGIALLFFSTMVSWGFYNISHNTNIYYFSNLIYLLSSILFITGYRKRRKIILLCLSGILSGLCLLDFYIITFCYDTSGPAGNNIISHWHWFNKYVSKNEYGFWERSLTEFENPQEKQFLIAVVGDSMTWGQGIKGKIYRFTEQLEEKLNLAFPNKRIKVLNFGLPGADTLKEIEVVKKFVSKVHPDIVLLCYVTNDITPSNLLPNTTLLYKKQYNTFMDKLSTINPTLNFLYWRLLGPIKYQDFGLKYTVNLVESYKNSGVFKEHVHDIQMLTEEIQKIGARTVFVLMPFPSMWQIFQKDIKKFVYNNIENFVSLTKTPIISLTYIEDKYSLHSFEINPFDAHPNEKIHKEIAEGIYNWFIKNDIEFSLLLNEKRSR